MNITRLKLSNFRNYESESIELSPGLNVITGENAQGKTNLLEAVFFCTFARSHRTASDGRLIRHGAPAFYIGVDLKSGTGTSRIEVKKPLGRTEAPVCQRQPAQARGRSDGHA